MSPSLPDLLFAALQKWIKPSEKRGQVQQPQAAVEPAVEDSVEPAEDLVDIPTELSQDIAKRIRDGAEMGDVMTLNAIAEEIKEKSDSCTLLSKQIVQMAEDFDLDGIQKLADDLDAH